MKYLDLDLLENPYGKRVGGGYETVRVGDGGRLHVRGPDSGPLCMQGRRTTDLRASEGRVVDCYRCIKLMAMNANAPLVTRDLTTAGGVKRKHLMVPGGRQGRMVADKKASPYAESGAAPFKRGPTKHPTQPWMTGRPAMAKTREERIREEGIALPTYYLPPTPEEVEAAQEVSFYESPAAKRRAAADRRRAGRVAASATMVANPSDEVMYTRSGMAYIIGADGKPRFVARSQAEKELARERVRATKGKQMKPASEMAMRLFHSGTSSSLKTAWDAVKLFRSNEVSSLEEAVQMAEGTRRANGRRR